MFKILVVNNKKNIIIVVILLDIEKYDEVFNNGDIVVYFIEKKFEFDFGG